MHTHKMRMSVRMRAQITPVIIHWLAAPVNLYDCVCVVCVGGGGGGRVHVSMYVCAVFHLGGEALGYPP